MWDGFKQLTFKVTKGHRYWCHLLHSTGHIRFPITPCTVSTVIVSKNLKRSPEHEHILSGIINFIMHALALVPFRRLKPQHKDDK